MRPLPARFFRCCVWIFALLVIHTFTPPAVAQRRCTRQQREADLASMQKWLVRNYGTTEPHKDLPKIPSPFFTPHGLRSNEGFGVTFTPFHGAYILAQEDVELGLEDLVREQGIQDFGTAVGALYDALRSGISRRRMNVSPQLVMYLPGGGSSITDGVPDPPYTVIGWGYVASPGAGNPPWIYCAISPSDYFLHQAGWHLENGGMLLTPREPDSRGQRRPVGGTFYHQLSWSVHIWLDPRGLAYLPHVQPCPPYRIPGVALPRGAFFRPDGSVIEC